MRKRLLVCASLTLLHIALVGLVIVTGPRGDVIAYSAPAQVTQDIFIRDLSRGMIWNVTGQFESHHESWPQWSPDGRTIVFSAAPDSYAPSDIYVIAMDGSGLRQLTDNHGNDFHPTWSPDGHQIAFASQRDSDLNIYVMNADGSHLRQLNQTTATDIMPAWSPDGLLIAYRALDGGTQSIRLVAAAGGVERLLIEGSYSSPVWSPDGTRLALLASENEIVMLNMADGVLQPLETTIYPAAFNWLPGRQQIAYVPDCRFQCDHAVYIKDVTTGREYRIAYPDTGTYLPAWRP